MKLLLSKLPMGVVEHLPNGDIVIQPPHVPIAGPVFMERFTKALDDLYTEVEVDQILNDGMAAMQRTQDHIFLKTLIA